MRKMLKDTFLQYAEPLIEKFVIGDVVSIRFNILDDFSVDHDIVAKTRFRNTLNVSVYAGIAYIADTLQLCRKHKLFLITEEMYWIVAAYYWVNPIYRSQFLGITGTEADYESMLYTADSRAQKYIRSKSEISELQDIVLQNFRYFTAVWTNRDGTNYEDAPKAYKLYMSQEYLEAFKTARAFPAQQNLVDKDGFILLEQNV